ncbi:hypothetical protein [Rhodopirellula sallentina]|nr:hypothetical protein [Rhodopirellula sallentina]
MPSPSIHELLGLPAEVTRPNAYQIMGLELGEPDPQKIQSAIQDRVRLLKKSKASTSAEVWQKAARAVQAAQKILCDPDQKAALDAQYGIVNDVTSEPKEPVDPLAALLPSAKKSSQPPASVPAQAPDSAIASQPAASAGAVSVPDSPSVDTSTSPQVPVSPRPVPELNSSAEIDTRPQIQSRRTSRRRRSSTGNLVFGSLVLGLLLLIVGGFAFVFLNGGGIVVVNDDNGFAINAATENAPSRPAQSTRARPIDNDGVMTHPRQGRVEGPDLGGPDFDLPSMPNASSSDSMTGNASMTGSTAEETPGMGQPSGPSMSDTAGSAPAMATPDSSMDSAPDPAPGSMMAPSNGQPPPNSATPLANSTPDTPQPPSPQEIENAEKAITASRSAIVQRNWAAMKSLAETAEEKAATDTQKQTAETLYQFADLATYYRGAIQRAMADLVSGNEIKLTDTMTFLVQRSSADEITLYRNKRQYEYTFEEVPLSVAHALAPFQLDVSSPEGKAAKAVFQSISEKATPGHRAESVKILRDLEKVEGADPKRLADFVESLSN